MIDELHLFDGTPRGDQLRAILSRIRRVRAYAAERGEAPDAAIQYVALSATLPAPEAAAARYFDQAMAIQIPGGRTIQAETLPITPDSAAELSSYLATFRARGWRKALAFCNSRAEVEAYATAVRARSPFGDAVYVHYSNIEPQRRHEIERQFADADAAICFASSTLELGIDIGNIDVVILIGPPGSRSSFVQRVGRGNRRGGATRVACFYRSPLERLLFAAILDENQEPRTENQAKPTDRGWRMEDGESISGDPLSSILHPQTADSPAHPLTRSPAHPFRPAVAIQQIFSLLKQSPTAALRLNELADLFAGMLTPEDLRMILANLQLRNYLRAGRPGEWRAGERLNELLDQQNSAQPGLSIYTNIQGSDMRQIEIRDQHTQQTVARVDALWLNREVLTLEGRPVAVEWVDGEALWVAAYQGHDPAQHPIYRSARQLLSYELAQLLPAQLGLPPGAAPFVGVDGGWYWFHWLGDLVWAGGARSDALPAARRGERAAGALPAPGRRAARAACLDRGAGDPLPPRYLPPLRVAAGAWPIPEPAAARAAPPRGGRAVRCRAVLGRRRRLATAGAGNRAGRGFTAVGTDRATIGTHLTARSAIFEL